MAEFSIKTHLNSELFDKEGTLFHDVLDDLEADIVDELSKVIRDSVEDQIRSDDIIFSGKFADSVEIKTIDNKHKQIINTAEGSLGFPYGQVLEFGFANMKFKDIDEKTGKARIWLKHAPDLVKWLEDKGWTKTKNFGEKGEMLNSFGTKSRFILLDIEKQPKRPYRIGFLKSRPKWEKVAKDVIVDKLTV